MVYYYSLLVYGILLVKYIKTQEIWDPDKPFEANEAEKHRVQLTEYVNGYQFIRMDENIKEKIIIAFLAYTGNEVPQITKFVEPSGSSNNQLGAIFERSSSDEKWGLVITKQQDYDDKPDGKDFRYVFDINVKEVTRRVYLYLNNLDDERPIIEVLTNPCKIEENKVGVSDCAYIIRDADGVIDNQMHYFLEGPAEVEATFEIKNIIDLEDGTKEWTVVLNTVKCLNFENISLYLLDFTVQDSVQNSSTTKIVINVIDMPDRPPVWRDVFSSQQFDEKTTQTFKIEAVDGDVEINNPINYRLVSDDLEDVIKIDETTGEITIAGIDRDALKKQIFTIKLTAFEVPDPTWFVDQFATIIVNDVNDNWPVITVEPKQITIPENTATKLAFDIEIVDLDLGENGTFVVELRDETTNNYESAFQIVPSEGYQRSKFTIAVLDSRFLDYEVLEWQKITVDIHAQENGLDTHFGSETIKINLENLNDELPIFEQEPYTAEVFEDIEADKYITTVYAKDRDIGDTVKHGLIGRVTNELFRIDETTGEMRTLKANAFDFETETEVIIQVQATDSLFGVGNRATTQLVITVQDVNDEAPVITVPDTTQINVKENEKDGTFVNNEITATDEDASADLKFEINWDESYARKNGQSVPKEYYERSIEVTTEDVMYSNHVRAVLTINEIIPDDTLDFERMDKLYIALVVKDHDQLILPNTDKVMITINIEDVNDNPPIFDKASIDSNKRVTEHASEETPIATIFATDADGPDHNKIEYSIRPYEDTIPDDWIGIDPVRGVLYVLADKKIDADGDLDAGRPPFLKLSYMVTATNKELKSEQLIYINVTDINDNAPIITVFQEVVKIHEDSSNNTDVQTVSVTDADRDADYNTPWFQFNSANDEIKNLFSIDPRSGRIFVHNKTDKTLDRDEGTAFFNIPIMIEDNHDLAGADSRKNPIYATFTIILLDINNKYPTISDEYERVPASEKAKEGEYVGSIFAFDDDEPGTDNTKINFKIISIEKGENAIIDDPPQDLFKISTDSEYISGKGDLTAGHDLRTYYGIYNVEIKTNDFGTYPGPLETSRTIYVDVAKYNFVGPKIMFPSDGEKIYLEETQALNQTLRQYGGEELKKFYAEDSQTQKWNILFKIHEDSDDGVFTLQNIGSSTARLVLLTYPTNVAYKLKIVADCKCVGDPPFTDVVTIDLRFISEDSEPYFEVPNEAYEDFPENSSGLAIRRQLPEAYFQLGEEWELFKIYYELKEDSSNCFELDAETNILRLNQILDREIEPNHTLRIAASKNRNGNNNPAEESMLTVFINVIDENDNPPNFQESIYYGSIKPSDDLGALILTVVATDMDINDILTISMVEDSFTANGNGIQNINKPFDYTIEKTSNLFNTIKLNILLNFSVQSIMNGYFLFDITVKDAVQASHTASVKIYIVSDSSRTAFKFQNNINDVEPQKDQIKEILEKQFSYICNIETIQKGTNEDGVPVDGETDVIMHFINPDNNEPIDSNEIEEITSDVEVFSKLRSEFLGLGLYLLSFTDPPTDENMEEILRAWLIGVSVILGTLCIALIIAFIVKTQSLLKRLSNLSEKQFGSQESGLNRIGLQAPNTNKRVHEGSNPVYSQEKTMANIDTASIGSGDSDLIGIEDNPNFEYISGNNQEDNFGWRGKQ